MYSDRICLIEGCNNCVPPQDEVDIGVGIITSNEPPICEECYLSNDPEIQKQITEIIEDYKNKDDDLPF